MIYFIQNKSNLAIKIGYASDSKRRFAQLQTASSDRLKLIGAIPGEMAGEKDLHTRFAKHRLAGEWFRPDSEVFVAICDLLAESARRDETRSSPRFFGPTCKGTAIIDHVRRCPHVVEPWMKKQFQLLQLRNEEKTCIIKRFYLHDALEAVTDRRFARVVVFSDRYPEDPDECRKVLRRVFAPIDSVFCGDVWDLEAKQFMASLARKGID